jgi:DNA-binding LytR/AlgR family response regulator
LEATFVARCAVRVAVIRAEEIDWVESAGNYAILHTATKNHMIRDTMAALETKLPEPRFLRVSRSAIVNLLRVKEIRTLKDGDHSLVLHTGSEVPMTRGVREVERRMREAR